MNLEYEVLKNYRLNMDKLVPYGFVSENGGYRYSKTILERSFRIDIEIDGEGELRGRVMDLDANEEYTNHRIKNVVGEFANSIKEEYLGLLRDIADKCYTRQFFIFDQSNRITAMIKDRFGSEPEFLWDSDPGFGVFRNTGSEKWFGIIMNIDRSKIVPGESGEIEAINVKLDDRTPDYLKKEGIYPAYHMNKKNWVSIILDDTLSDEELMELIMISYELSNKIRYR